MGTGAKLREYRRYIGLRGIRDVEFLGRVTDEEKARYFASADIFSAPATGQESFGVVLLEAMAAGVPVVTSRVSAMPEVAGGAAVLVDPRDVDDIARGIDEAREAAR